MSAPKSVVKINKDGVFYESNVEWCQYTIKELCRAALRDVGRFVARKFRENYYAAFKKQTGKGGRTVQYKVWATPTTEYPRVEVGLPSSGRRLQGFYSFFQEVGSSKQEKLGILENSVKDNVATIIEIESKYLTALENEAEALRLIDENDYDGGEDDDQ